MADLYGVHQRILYIPVILVQGTAPSFGFQTFDSPNLSPLCLQYTLLPARLEDEGGAVPSITDIYSLMYNCTYCTVKA